ncbi:hypothetical protein AB0K00_21725 [Dactylosporangium sp. NPDC049525]|uniref:hypothetical protein n=1 Tax=Dactylosporangium sp. NPDC049525 TaxID=3154730 RepID=UPI0034439D6C
MPRGSISSADAALLAAVQAQGVTATPTQLERWRSAGLLQRNVRSSLGRGRGSVSMAPADAVASVVWLAQHGRQGARPWHLALEAFAHGLPLSEQTIRSAWRNVVKRGELPVERDLPKPSDGADLSEWAWAVAERSTDQSVKALLPQRIRQIDAMITAAGVPWSSAELATYDRSIGNDEPVTRRDVAAYTVAAVLAGAPELVGPAIAPHVRALIPAGAANPMASMLEFSEPSIPDATDLYDADGIALIPNGDLRNLYRQLVDDAPLPLLLASWQAAARLQTWAHDECNAVEAELQTQTADGSTLRWMLGTAFGLHRLMLCLALRDRQFGTPERAETAVTLLGMHVGFQRLRTILPDSDYQVLAQLLPDFLLTFFGFAVDTAESPTLSATDGRPIQTDTP